MSSDDTILRLRELTDQIERSIPPEALLRLLVDMTVDGIAVVRDEVIQFCSRGFTMFFGYDDDELTNRSIHDLVPETIRPMHHEYVDQYMRRPRSIRMNGRNPVRGRKKDGSEIICRVGLTPLPERSVLVAVKLLDER